MTGFARGQGVAGAYGWAWEIRSVNAKGLDLRLRLPPGWDAIEPPLRARAAEVLARGTLHATLNVDREGVAPVVKVNEAGAAGGDRDVELARRPHRGRAARGSTASSPSRA